MDEYTVKYNLPNEMEESNNTYGRKSYNDKNNNTVNIYIEKENAQDLLNGLSTDYILTSNYYQNQQITDISDYSINNYQYKYRAITYNDSFGEYTKLYFVYGINNSYTYVVEATIKDNSLSLEQMDYFLDITVE